MDTKSKIKVTSKIQSINDFLKQFDFVKILDIDFYAYLLANYQKRQVVVKIYFSDSDENSEYEILKYIQNKTNKPDIFPEPITRFIYNEIFHHTEAEYDDEENNEPIITIHDEKNIILEEVSQIIVYQYFEGTKLSKLKLEKEDKEQLRIDILDHLEEIHKMGLIHGEISKFFIMKKKDGRYVLINYGRCFSSDWRTDKTKFQPMEFMLDDELYCNCPIITQQGELEDFIKLYDGL